MGHGFIWFIEEFLPITGIWWIDIFIYLIIKSVAFAIAFPLTGKIFDFLDIYHSGAMKIVHWTIRIFIILLPSIIVLIVGGVRVS